MHLNRLLQIRDQVARVFQTQRTTNVLVEDINGKVATIDPLFTAVADLSTSVSDLNYQAREFGQKAASFSASAGKAGTAYTVGKVASKLFGKKKGKKNE